MIKPAILINAFQRPGSLQRLLDSLNRAIIHESDVNIIFSLEHGADEMVIRQVNDFQWRHGKKEIILHEEKQGLIGHFLFCGGLTKTYGAIIYLEDDLFVGRDFYTYSIQVLNTYANEPDLAGFSLNALWFNGYNHLPFEPVDDGNPCFFLQVPWYQGQIYTSAQWAGFAEWLEKKEPVSTDLLMHDSLVNFKYRDDWFPIKSRYLIENNKYYAFPRRAQCVNFGDAGTHFCRSSNFFQTQLALEFPACRFKPFKECLAVYDSFFELLPEKLKHLAPGLADYDLETDLYGTKPLNKSKKNYVITAVKPPSFEKSYGLEMHPHELNILYDIPGEHFYLTKRENVQDRSLSARSSYEKFFYHHKFRLSRRQKLYFALKRLFGR